MSDSPRGAGGMDKDELLDRIQSAASRMSDNIEREKVEAKAQEAKVAQRAARRRLGSPAVTAAACIAFLATTIANLTGNGFFRSEPQPVLETEYRQYLKYKVEEIEAHFRDHGSLPPDLATLDPDDVEGWAYERTGVDGFRLTLIEDEFQLVHDEASIRQALDKPAREETRASQ